VRTGCFGNTECISPDGNGKPGIQKGIVSCQKERPKEATFLA